jgi:hypothetical protein
MSDKTGLAQAALRSQRAVVIPVQRIEQKLSALAERISSEDPELAKALRTAWQLPARSLAFRNAAHQKDTP